MRRRLPHVPRPDEALPPVACPEEIVCATDAVVRCITVGNFEAQFSPEFWSSRLALLLAEFDRVAEQRRSRRSTQPPWTSGRWTSATRSRRS